MAKSNKIKQIKVIKKLYNTTKGKGSYKARKKAQQKNREIKLIEKQTEALKRNGFHMGMPKSAKKLHDEGVRTAQDIADQTIYIENGKLKGKGGKIYEKKKQGKKQKRKQASKIREMKRKAKANQNFSNLSNKAIANIATNIVNGFGLPEDLSALQFIDVYKKRYPKGSLLEAGTLMLSFLRDVINEFGSEDVSKVLESKADVVLRETRYGYDKESVISFSNELINALNIFSIRSKTLSEKSEETLMALDSLLEEESQSVLNDYEEIYEMLMKQGAYQ